LLDFSIIPEIGQYIQIVYIVRYFKYLYHISTCTKVIEIDRCYRIALQFKSDLVYRSLSFSYHIADEYNETAE